MDAMFAKKVLSIIGFFLITIVITGHPNACGEESFILNYEGQPQKVLYDFYIPPKTTQGLLDVLVCVGGLPIINDQYVYSSTQDCMDERWKEFASDHQVAILGLGFLFKPQQWAQQASYQYPQAWSGQALNQILNIAKQKFPLNIDSLYLFGISAGAQFSLRFALMNPRRVKAVAAHAFGGYELPTEFVPTKFLVTVGQEDNDPISRREFLELFFSACQREKIDIQKEIIPGLKHRQTEVQNQMSREFFSEILLSNKRDARPNQ